ncbi:cation diffusion facilitator family transporter [Desulfarculus baarsii]
MPTDHDRGDLSGRRITWLGLWVNVALIALKVLGGVLGRSQALIADAVHSISDLFSDVVVLWGLRMRGKGPDSNHHFGHARLETMSAAVVGLTLAAVAALLGYDAVLSLGRPAAGAPTGLALAVAAVSILAKEMLFQVTMAVGRRIHSASVRANAWHHRSDALSSVAVLAGVGVAMIWPGLDWADALATLVVALMILAAGWRVLWAALRELSDAAPPAEITSRIAECVRTVPGVRGFHDLRVRSSGGLHQAQVHVVVPAEMTVAEGHAIAKTVELCLLRDIEGLDQVIVHMDPEIRRE